MKSCPIKLSKWLFAIIAILFILIAGVYVYYEYIWEKWPTTRIERITGIRVPSYKVIEYNRGKRYFNGDYKDSYIIEFKTMPSDELFDEIDRLIATGNTGWRRDSTSYSFSVVWGNGLPTPKGESKEDDGMFNITISRGERIGIIEDGAW